VSQPQRIAVLGGRGMLGTDLVQQLKAGGLSPTAYDLPECDITDEAQLHEAVAGCDGIVNCAAYTNVDGAETEQALAHRVNATAVRQLGQIAKDKQQWVLHISTDFVFDGSGDQLYREADAPSPLSEYGRSKLAGERLLTDTGCACAIVRVQWTYGHHGTNFIKKLLERARSMSELRVVDDQVGSPSATVDVARALCDLIQKRPEGLFHLASQGYVSRYDMARFVVDRLGLDIPVHPCKTADFASPAQRPLNSRFDCTKVCALLDEPMKHWQDSLRLFLEQL
jgi:dTDP-4-dehydrorhamnose reductase